MSNDSSGSSKRPRKTSLPDVDQSSSQHFVKCTHTHTHTHTHTNTRRSHTKTKSVTNTGSSLLPPGSWPRTAPRVPSYARAGKHTQNRQTDSNFLKSAWSDCRKHVQSWRFFNLRYHLRNLPKSALKKAMRYLTFLLHKKAMEKS